MTTRYWVELTLLALADLDHIHDWLTMHAGAEVADRFLADMLDTVDTLERFPDRGSVPLPLRELNDSVRQMPVHRYRLIYDVRADIVSILAVLHERRDYVAALSERLTR